MAFYLTNKAKADLKDIGRYTQKEWGVKQRDIYLGKIDRAFHVLANSPGKKGRNCDYIRDGYRNYVVGKHVIYYRKVGVDDIEIVRVLHGQMDIDRQFGRG